MFGCLKVTFSLLLVIEAFSSVTSYRHPNDELESVTYSAPKNGELPPLQWNGVCPTRAKNCPQSFQGTPPLILISLDGFRSDYLKRGFSPTISKLGQCGVQADYIHPVFPSKTFPNHYSIVTGLNPESHGIIDNSMYEPFKKTQFRAGDPEMYKSYWFQKEAIWVTAEKQGKTTASYFWFGSDVKVDGITPTYYKEYKPKASFDERVDQILQWLDLPPAKRPKFLTLYVNQPDNAGHWYGTDAKELNQAVSKVDRMINRLYAGLQMRGIVDCVNVIILSDHGMSNIDCKLSVDIQNYMDVSKIYSTMGPFGRLRPKGRKNDTAIKEIVDQLRCKSEHMRAYQKEHLPVRMHYASNARIEPIFLDMDSSWTVVSKTVEKNAEICTGGAHGYDNLYPDMRAIFIAQGPSFKRGLKVRPFINTELYELFSELIKITPNPNNGTRGSLHHLLKSPQRLEEQVEQDPPAVGDVPSDDLEYNFRLYVTKCNCTQSSKQKNRQDISQKRYQHLPFGIPYSPNDNVTLRLLYNEDYTLAFDLKYRIPMWTSFTIDGKKFDSKMKEICWTGDARIPISDAATCIDYVTSIVKKRNILQRPLYPPAFSSSSLREEASYITNSIPKSVNHTNIIEKQMTQDLADLAKQHGLLNVVMGPAFNVDDTGLRPHIGQIMRTHAKFGPLVVPTHIFVIATWCRNKVDNLVSCGASNLQSRAFLLPNDPYPNNCESGETVIRRNVARVVDVENLTGLSFYTALPIYDAIRLRTSVPTISVPGNNIENL